MWLHAAYAFICGSAPARLGDAGQGLRAAPVLRAAPAQCAACGCGDLAGVPPGESAGGHLWVRAELKLLTSAETV